MPRRSPDRAINAPGPSEVGRSHRSTLRYPLVAELCDLGLVSWERGGRVVACRVPAALTRVQVEVGSPMAGLTERAERAVDQLKRNPGDAAALRTLEEALLSRTALLVEARRAVEADYVAGASRFPLPARPRAVPGGEMTLKTARGLAAARLTFDARLSSSGYREAHARLEEVEKKLLMLIRLSKRSKPDREAALQVLKDEQRFLHTLLRGKETALIQYTVGALASRELP